LPNNYFPFPASGTGHAPFSFDAWFATSSTGVLFGQNTVGPFNTPIGFVPGIYVGEDGLLRVQVFWSGSINPLASTVKVNDGHFHHVAVTYDGTTESAYLDGTLFASEAFTQTSYSTSYAYQFGTGYTNGRPQGNGGWFNFSGLIDEIHQFNVALTGAQVQSIFSAGGIAMCAPGQGQAPVVNAGPNQTITLPTNSVALNGSVTSTDAADTVVTWSEVSGEAGVVFSNPNGATTTATFPDSGVYVLQLTAVLGTFTSTSQVTVTVNPGTGPSTEVSVSINSPTDGSVLTTIAPVNVTITGGSWTLDYALNGADAVNPVFTVIASGSGAVTNQVIGTFDPTLLLNGTYLIRLTSIDGNGHPAVATFSAIVRGQQRSGTSHCRSLI